MVQLVLWLFFCFLSSQLITCKTPAKKRNVRKIGKSAESLVLPPPNKPKTEVKTAQEKTKEKPKTDEKVPTQEKPPTHEKSQSKGIPLSNSIDQVPDPSKEKSAVMDRTQQSQSTLNYKEYTAQSIEKSKVNKTKSVVEQKEKTKETKTAVEPKEKTNEKTKSALGLSPQVATGAEPSVTPTTTQTPAALITNSTQQSHKQIDR
ncbi:hypothetical protein M3Y96_00912900 [Aphelenchoides besseyi]|nr:hypothetical protein M3Y96_00912900 [Aphelenchoides besseyi]